MATTEHARHQLYQRLNEIIGPDQADTLMELLPTVGWADVATKTDLAHQTALIDARFDRIDSRFRQIDSRFEQIDSRFRQIDTRLGQIDSRFRQIDTRLGQIDFRFEQIDARFDHLHTTIDLKIEASELRVRTEIEALRTELHRSLRINMLVTVGVLGTLTTVVSALTAGG